MAIEQVITEIQRMSDADFRRVTDEVARREETLALNEAARRAAELDAGHIQPLSHEDVFDPLKKRFRMRLIYHPAVRVDLAEAAGFLEEKRNGLGAAFIAEAERTVRSIVENPFRFALLRDGTRRARLDRFPNAAYFDLPSPRRCASL